MSEELDYLLEVRKEAIGPYFRFLKKAGEHLDPKTRALLSVITKVDAQTENGFRQYLVRAMQAGNSADEVLDAMLVCMPSLGFSKIVWAIDIILQMDIPEFKPSSLGQKQQWHKLIAIEELSEGVSQLDYADRSCFVNRHGDDIKVFDSRCPHQITNIPVLALDGNTLTCPKHSWKFDINSGDCIEKGNRPLQDIRHKVENGFLMVFA